MKLLILGGAGYISSHMVRYAREHGHEVVVLDQKKLSQLLKGRYCDGVLHFAANYELKHRLEQKGKDVVLAQ